MPESAFSSSSAPLLHVEALESVRGDRTLFRDLNVELRAGEVLFVEGANGSGKTTLLRMICGLIAPNAGTIRWNGESIGELAEEFGRQLLYIGHRPGIKEELTALENLQIANTLNGLECPESELWDALSRIGLRGFEDVPTRYLSQGQKRRVALTRLLLSRSPLWVLDEPFVALDVTAVEALQQVIREHVESGGMVVVTTHQTVELLSGTVQRLRLGGEGAMDV